MLYKIAHLLKDKVGWLWNLIERLNSMLFTWRYGKKLRDFKFTCVPEGYDVVAMRDVPTKRLVTFFEHQPGEAYTYFKPHGFDAKSIEQLRKNSAYLAYLLMDNSNNRIAGYCFIRAFFMGKGYRGRMVDIDYRGKGVGKVLSEVLNEVGFGIGLRLFTSISPENYASLNSVKATTNIKIVRTLENGYYYIECTPKKPAGG